MSMPTDLPDWQAAVTPATTTANAFSIGGGFTGHLVHVTTPFRVWGAWLNVYISAAANNPGGYQQWGVKITAIGGTDLVRVNCGSMVANQVSNGNLFVNLGGYQVPLSAGFYTVDIVADAGLGFLNSNANGGIVYSVP